MKRDIRCNNERTMHVCLPSDKMKFSRYQQIVKKKKKKIRITHITKQTLMRVTEPWIFSYHHKRLNVYVWHYQSFCFKDKSHVYGNKLISACQSINQKQSDVCCDAIKLPISKTYTTRPPSQIFTSCVTYFLHPS